MRRHSPVREQQTLGNCLQNLRVLEGFQATFLAEKSSGENKGLLRLKGSWGKANYAAVIKLGLTPKTVEVVAGQIKNLTRSQARPLLITDYVAPAEAEAFKRQKIEFVDAAGNIYLNQPPLYVEITGRKRSEKPQRAKQIFQKTSLKLIYLLLKQPQAVNWSYRDLAQEADVALGTVGGILADLREMDFIRLAGPNLQVIARGNDLLNRWEVGYAERLRPKLTLKTCRFSGAIGDLVAIIRRISKPGEILIGGELGAALLTKQLRPASAILHINGDILKVMQALRLLPHPEGNVELLQIFGNQNGWNERQPQGVQLADPLLIHAELLRGHSERLHEMAQLILNKYLAPRMDA